MEHLHVSSNTTKCNVCNASILSQLVKPLNVSKPDCSNNVTERNVSKGPYINYLGGGPKSFCLGHEILIIY